MKNKRYKQNLFNFLEKIKNVEGDILEVGTYSGDTTEVLCDFVYQNKLNKKVFSIDTFEGYIEEDLVGALKEAKSHFSNGDWKYSYEKVQSRLKTFDKICTILKGDSKLCIPELIKEKVLKSVSLLYVDCNLYPPSISAMKNIYPIMKKNSIIVIDEHWLDKYGKYGGETRALYEFANSINAEPIHYSKQSGPSYYIIK